MTRSELDGLCRHPDGHGFAYEGPVEHPGGDRSVHLDDPEGNVVGVWDRAREGVQAL